MENMEVSNDWILWKRFRQVLLVGLIIFPWINGSHRQQQQQHDDGFYDSQGRYKRLKQNMKKVIYSIEVYKVFLLQSRCTVTSPKKS